MKEFLQEVWNPFVDFLRRDGHGKHIAAGFALGLLSVLFAIMAGLMKEEHDESNGGKFDYADLVFSGKSLSSFSLLSVCFFPSC